MPVADGFPHLNNSPAQGAQKNDDWQGCRAVIHETRWVQAEKKEWELEVENLSGFILSFMIIAPSLFYFFSFLLKVVMTIFDTVSMEKAVWAIPIHVFDAVEKGTFDVGITNFNLFMTLCEHILEGGL